MNKLLAISTALTFALAWATDARAQDAPSPDTTTENAPASALEPAAPPDPAAGGAAPSEDAPATAPEPAASPDPATGGAAPSDPEVIEAAPDGGGEVRDDAEVEAEADEPPPEIFPVHAAAGIGLVIPSIYSSLDPAFTFSFEGGYVLPVLGQRLAVLASFTYSRPEKISRYDYDDPRLPADGAYRYYFTEDQYSIGIGVLGRLFQPRSTTLFGVNFFGKLAARLELQHGAEGGRAVNPFGRNEETATRGAIFLAAGAEYLLGPGAIQAELSFAYAPLEQDLSGNVGTGGLGFVVGYALLLGAE